MRIECPICGERDRREFYYQGAAVMLARPGDAATEAEWQSYLHLRENPAGRTDELWQHEAGCRAWVVVTRDTTTHVIATVRLATDVAQTREATG
ncbi:sarcosine oxidase subunit delta [Sulfitobacter sp. F26204]|uniref:sarcosine oxidase subunit delta n=1 Tax=Sulfitobacter sp. F26204 TaxID=2996014 RepID=UPI00225E0AC2|nr:sarcosine oxidase subunit delta [Sulfitobacter sp. F26204]MCX7560851.1 sarcosine oxidase subunit delta [Sulfitobacter sp. F26204]